MNNVPHRRAEMPRPDALLEMLQATDTNNPVWPSIFEQVALSQDAMTPSMKLALDTLKAQSLAASGQALASLPQELQTHISSQPSDYERSAGYPQTGPQQEQQQLPPELASLMQQMGGEQPTGEEIQP